MVERVCSNVLMTLIASKNDQSMSNESKNIHKEWKMLPFWL
jgi:hypothetical protein